MTNTKVHKSRGSSPAADSSADRADDLLGAVVPLRIREAPVTSERNDLSNVIPFHPRHRAENDNSEKPAPAVVCNHTTRPCPFLSAFDWRKQWPLLLIGSVAAHAGMFAWFMQEPPPKASIGLEVISVEMVLGADAPAGTSPTPGQNDVETPYIPDIAPPDHTKTELTEKPILEAKTEPKEEPREEPKPVVQEEPKPQIMAAAPPEPQPEPELAVTPELKKEPVVETVKEKPKPVAQKPVQETGKAKKQRIAAASDASVAANSVGRGRSDNDVNYAGIVSAHLARHQSYLTQVIRGDDQGRAIVRFWLDGGGRVTSVQLLKGSGHSNLDREVQNMVRRASPFPPHPKGTSAHYTVPVKFTQR